MKIKQYEHQCSIGNNNFERRMCWALLEDDDEFIDSFDYNSFLWFKS